MGRGAVRADYAVNRLNAAAVKGAQYIVWGAVVLSPKRVP